MISKQFIYANRFNTFYFRQRTPFDILNAIPCAKKEIKISLQTKCRTKAIEAARHHKVMFDLLFGEIRESMKKREWMTTLFSGLDEGQQRELMLQQRAVEAINDQQFTQQLFFLLERKDRIKKAFDNIDALRPYSLSDIDLGSVDKINRFIAIIDLLSSPTLSDPEPYISQIQFKQKKGLVNYDTSSNLKSVNIGRMVVKCHKPTPPPSTPSQLTRYAKASRNNAGSVVVDLIKGEMQDGTTPAVRTNTNNQYEDIILENISLDNEEDTHNFVKLLSLLEKGESVQTKDFETFSKPVIVPKSMLKVSELFNKFYEEQSAEWRDQKTHSTNLSFYNTFIDIVGDIFVDELNYDVANTYINTLRKLPANRNKLSAFRDKSIENLLAMEGTFEPMKTTNANKNIEKIKSVFIWAVQRKYMSVNILDKMRIKDKAQKVQAKDQRDRFNSDDLGQIFGSDKYVKSTHIRTYEYWLPLLGLYTGARLGELSQLRLNDVYKEDNVWLIDFNEQDDKTLKTVNSVRKVPIHKTLVKLGFVKYVQHLQECFLTKTTHSNLLFPDLIKGRDGYGHNSSKAFDRYIRSINVKTPSKSFHSLRHTFSDERKQADENPAMTAELLGHEIDGETLGRYAKSYKITLKKAAIDHYQPLTELQIQRIKPFRLWKEFKPKSSLRKYTLVDDRKSIHSNKFVHKALAKVLNIAPPIEVPRKPRKDTATD